MIEKALIVAPKGPTRSALEAFFGARCDTVLSAKREAFIAAGQLVMDDERVLIDGEDAADADVAIVLDSGFMWPLPILDPTPEQWSAYRDDFDDYLRDERESASLWFSFLDVINLRVPVCVNRQVAFALESTKPDAFELLRSQGVAVAPTITTNAPDALAAFAAENTADLLELPLTGASEQWLDREKLAELALREAPVMVQAVDSGDATRVMALGPDVVPADGSYRSSTGELSKIQDTLGAEWTELVFRPTDGGWALSDFTAAPTLDDLDEATAEEVLEHLWGLLQKRSGGH